MKRVLWLVLGSGMAMTAAAADDGPLFARPRHDPVVVPDVARALQASADGTAAVWVFFTDKGVDTAAAYETALADVARTYHPAAVRRRALRRTFPGLFDHRDLPLPTSYVDAVRGTGARVRTQSTWLGGVSATADAEQVGAIAALPFVGLVTPVARAVHTEPPAPDAAVRGGDVAAGNFYGLSLEQLTQINIPAVHAAGFTGAGVVIGILDTGFIRTHEAFNEPSHPVQVLGEWDVINDDGDTSQEPGDPGGQSSHGTYILGTIGAFLPNTLVGGAYDAAFYLAKTEDISSETPIEEDFYVAGLQWIEANGADVATSSLGYIAWYTQADLDGQTAVTTVAVNIATGNGLACCTAAGNSGHDTSPTTSHLIAPADAFEVFSCGAVTSEGSIAGFSSDGPTADGRTKPEVLARGVGTWTVSPSDDFGYVGVSGTSLSTPLVASSVALIVQAHPDWTVAQMRSALLQTAGDYVANGVPDPVFVRGYGIIDVLAAINMTFEGDVDTDGDTDLVDFSAYRACLGGPGVPAGPGCSTADLDEDGDVDMFDFILMQTNFTGPWTD
ncbi:MAG: S8 family serine peptidase [Phycisphaerae bacterium]